MTGDLWLRAFALGFGFLIFVTLVEIAKRKLGWSSELTRRLVHIGAGMSALLDYLFVPGWLFLILSLGGGLIFAVSFRVNLITSVHSVTRRTYGELWLTAGVVGAYLISLAKPDIFIPSLLTVTFADSAAGLVSDLFKQPRKMWRGSIVFFAISFCIFLSSQGLLLAATKALIVTAVERYSPLGSDNVTVTISAAALLLL